MTFSVCVREETDGENLFGVGVATDAPAVGALAPHVGRAGVVSTQSFVNVRLGRRGVELLADMGIEDALTGLLAVDDHSENRQVHGLDARGNAYAFSGDDCEGWYGHQVHKDEGVTVAGNMLTSEETLNAVVDAVSDPAADDPVARLVDALAAGTEAGGDKRGHSSAAVRVSAPKTEAYHDLRVDHHETPVAELRRVYEAAKDESDGFSEDSKHRIFD